MKTHIAENRALQLYNKLKQIHIDALKTNSNPPSRVIALRGVLEMIFKEITKDSVPTNTNLFGRIDYAKQFLGISNTVKDNAHSARKICNPNVHGDVAANEPDYQFVVKAIAGCIEEMSGTEIPPAIKSIYDRKTIYDWSKEMTVNTPQSLPQKTQVKSPELTIRQKDLYNNPQPRLAVGLLLDTSGSMLTDNRIGELNDGVKLFFDSVSNDEDTKYSVELCIVTFGGAVSKILDFANLDRQVVEFNQRMPLTVKSPNDPTPMGEAVELAIKLLNERKAEYKSAGVEYYQPWLVLMTDGQATDSIDNASMLTTGMEKLDKLTIFPTAIGRGANLKELGRFSLKRTPLRLKGLNFKEFFEWLVDSAKSTSQKAPGQKTKLAPTGWAEI